MVSDICYLQLYYRPYLAYVNNYLTDGATLKLNTVRNVIGWDMPLIQVFCSYNLKDESRCLGSQSGYNRNIKPIRGKKVALLAPSSRSRRPWEFIAVTDREALEQLSKVREHGSKHIAGAPLCIVVAADPEVCDIWMEDASITAIIIQLAAHSMGLGSCWVQARERFAPDHIKTGDRVKSILNIPEKYEIECLIAIGYPAEEKEPYKESDLKLDKLHFEHW
mgnify:FL=1